MLKKLAVGALTVVTLFCNVYAETDITDFTNDLSAKLSVTEAGKKGITITIYRPEKTAESIPVSSNVENISSVIAGIFETEKSESGSYSIDFALEEDDESGNYTVSVYDIEKNKNSSDTFFFSGKDDYEDVITALNGITAENAQEFFATGQTNSFNNYELLGMDTSLFGSADKAKLGTLAVEYLKDNSFSTSDRAKNSKIINYMLLASCASNGNLTDFDTLIKKSYITSNVNGALYEEAKSNLMTNTVKNDILSRLSNTNYSSVEEFEDALIKAFVLEINEHNDGYEHAKSIITKFQAKVGITASSYSDNAFYTVSGNHYNDYSNLVAALNANNTTVIIDNSYHGGGGKGGVSIPQTSTAVTPPEDVTNVGATAYFDDIASVEWAHDAIYALKVKNVISGKGEKTFAPDDYVTREEFVKMIVEISNLMQSGDIPEFTDVSEGDWFYKYVNIAYSNNIVKGISENSFGSGNNITREDIAVILFNASNNGLFSLTEKSEKTFVDQEDIAEYAKIAVAKLSSAQIINGFEDGSFNPKAYATRAQAAKMIYESFK